MALDGKSCGWCADLEDERILSDHLTKIYMYMTEGRISKPMTFPTEVIDVHEDLEQKHFKEMLAEAMKELDGEK